jgi:hypothetical protein
MHSLQWKSRKSFSEIGSPLKSAKDGGVIPPLLSQAVEHAANRNEMRINETAPFRTDIGSSAVASSLGAAGALIVLLLWVYYSAQIFLIGAEFTKVYANSHGSKPGAPVSEGRKHDTDVPAVS